MSAVMVPIYRLPIANASRVGRVRVVKDRNGVCYVNGSRVQNEEASGVFLVLTLANEQSYYVKSEEYRTLTKTKS